jgi:hypothetical protein
MNSQLRYAGSRRRAAADARDRLEHLRQVALRLQHSRCALCSHQPAALPAQPAACAARTARLPPPSSAPPATPIASGSRRNPLHPPRQPMPLRHPSATPHLMDAASVAIAHHKSISTSSPRRSSLRPCSACRCSSRNYAARVTSCRGQAGTQALRKSIACAEYMHWNSRLQAQTAVQHLPQSSAPVQAVLTVHGAPAPSIGHKRLSTPHPDEQWRRRLRWRLAKCGAMGSRRLPSAQRTRAGASRGACLLKRPSLHI